MNASAATASTLLALSLCLVARAHTSDRPWNEILGPPQGARPAPQEKVVWRDDLAAALDEAAKTGRPLFVTLRCLPCKQCADFDREVLEGGPLLDPLLAQFVTVRLTDANAIDLHLFPVEGFQDLDLSWWGWFLSPDARVYGVFGGKDEVSDSTRISPQALATALERVLRHHYDPRRASWNVDGDAPDRSGAPRGPRDLPGWSSWSKRDLAEARKENCLHCHELAEVLRQPAIDAKTFDKRRDLDVWPFPENVGLVVERDDGLRIASVKPDSPAARAGLQKGDVLAAAGDRRLFGQADFRAALQRGPRGAGKIEVRWLRGSDVLAGSLEVESGWRKTVLGWRKSVAEGNFGAHPGFAWPQAAAPEERRKRGIASGSMAVRPWYGKEKDWPALKAGLSDDLVITAVNGESPDISGRDFMTWFRLRFDPGDSVTFTARDARGREREIHLEVGAGGR